jgi:hypothetical protein
VLDDERLAHALAERYGLDRLDLDHFPSTAAAAALVSVDTGPAPRGVAGRELDGGRLLVAVADPAGGAGGRTRSRARPGARSSRRSRRVTGSAG